MTFNFELSSRQNLNLEDRRILLLDRILLLERLGDLSLKMDLLIGKHFVCFL